MKQRSRRRVKVWVASGLLIVSIVWIAYASFRHEMVNSQLVAAVNSHNSGAVDRALAMGADPDTRDYTDSEVSSMELAKRAVQRLLRIRGVVADKGVSVLAKAVEDNNDASALLLLHAGAHDVDARVSADCLWRLPSTTSSSEDVRGRNGAQTCPLIVVAASRGDAAFVDALIARGAQIDARRSNATIALLECTLGEPNRELYPTDRGGDVAFRDALSRYEQVVHDLLEHGANPNLTIGWDFDVLDAWIDTGDEKIADDLLEHGANPNVTDSYKDRADQDTVLSHAIRLYSRHTVAALVAHGARVNDAAGQYGATALMWASHFHDLWEVRFLLNHGADANLRDRDGHDALYYLRAFPDDVVYETASGPVKPSPAELRELKELRLLLERHTRDSH